MKKKLQVLVKQPNAWISEKGSKQDISLLSGINKKEINLSTFLPKALNLVKKKRNLIDYYNYCFYFFFI